MYTIFCGSLPVFRIGTLADISAALFWRAKCCVKAALVAPLATPANWKYKVERDSIKKTQGSNSVFISEKVKVCIKKHTFIHIQVHQWSKI